MEQALPLSDGESNTGAHTSYRFDDRSFLSLIKKEVTQEARGLGFSAESIGKLEITISELSSNLIKFGERKREFLWKTINQQGKAGIEMLAIDKGAGMSHVYQAMQDGHSTSGTAGEGLGAIQRLSDFFDIYSQPNVGTVVLCRFFAKKSEEKVKIPLTVGSVSVAKPGERVCGDGYQIDYLPEKKIFRILIVDGLGHGPDANQAAQAAIKVYKEINERRPGFILEKIHQLIKQTRGIVGMAFSYDIGQQKLFYSGIGNIGGKITAWEKPAPLVSSNGTLGYKISRVREHAVDWKRGQLLIVHSDGIPSRWDLTAYPQIERHDPIMLAACLYRDYSRAHDDATIIVSKYPRFDEKDADLNY